MPPASPYRTESSSLVYQATEIRTLMAAARAIADPSDQLSCVTALRSPLFGCGDDDLFALQARRRQLHRERPGRRTSSPTRRWAAR